MTAKTLRNTGSVDCTQGISRDQRAINRRNKIESSCLNKIESSRSKKTVSSSLSDVPYGLRYAIKTVRKHQAIRAALIDYEKRLCADEAKKFGKQLPDRDPNVIFTEKPFGSKVQFGNKMVFACSGIPIPDGSAVIHLTRFVTSARLVKEFDKNRNKKDELRVSVRLPDKTIARGFLGLYDDDIAIVTCIEPLAVRPVDVDLWANSVAVPSSHKIQAAGRAFRLTDMRTIDGYWSVGSSKTLVPCSEDFTEAVLGGPVIGNDARLLGMVLDLCLHGGENFKCASFLPLDDLYKRLQHFQILSPKQQSFQGYSTPPGVSTVIPSGFMKTNYRLKSFGYPMPPPLVLELNGELRNRFEERFGESLAWKGYPYGDPPCSSREPVWAKLKKTVATDISRRVVSLASFNGDQRYFACTGLLIKWPGSTAILTSASLVRKKEEDKIDPDLRIEVSLPPNQRSNGKLEYFGLNYNIAIISVEKNFSAIRPEDIFNEKKYYSEAIVQKASEKVFAIGRGIKFGLLMASAGEVNHSAKVCKLDCKDLQVSTCKIKKVGIGGPLINFTGSFVGMNFYDGSQVTPFLPRSKIVEVLISRSCENVYPLPSKDGLPTPLDMEYGSVRGKNKWPVPEPYWYHGGLDVDRYDLPMPRGRTLQ